MFAVYCLTAETRKKMLMAVLRKLTLQKKKRKQKHHKKQKVLSNWESMYNAIQEHPLTQAKIINEQILRSNQEQMDKVHKRLDDIELQVGEIERRIETKEKRSKKRKAQKEPDVEEVKESKTLVKKIVADAQLSEQEKAIVEHLRTQEESDAETISAQFKISRSNASLKLNKLYNWGFLDKRLEEKTVFYKIKD